MSDTDQCAREVTWGDQTYPLNLNHPWVRRVLNYRGVNGKALPALSFCFEIGNYTASDVERVLELGLIGTGMDEREADKLLDAHVRGKPFATHAVIASGLVGDLFLGNAS